MYNFDASSIILLWDNYPFENKVFTPLWEKFKENIESGLFVISDVALIEAKDKIDSKDFNSLIANIQTFNKETIDLIEAQKIKNLLDIEEENYGNGVGEKDIFIIAIAKRANTILINDEKRQNNLPKNKSNYKMPLVCNLPEVQVENINLQELLNRNNLWQ